MYGDNEDAFSVDDWRNEPSNFISQTAKWTTDISTGSTTTPTSHKSTTGVGSVIRIQVDPYQLAELSSMNDSHPLDHQSHTEVPLEPHSQIRKMELINRYASDVEESDCEGMFALDHYSKFETRKSHLNDPTEVGDTRGFDLEHESGFSQPSIQKASFSGSGKQATPRKSSIEIEDEASEPHNSGEASGNQYPPRRFNEDDPFSLDAQQGGREFSDQERYTNSMERPDVAADRKVPPIFEESELATEFDQSLMNAAWKHQDNNHEESIKEAGDAEFGTKSIMDPEPELFELGAEFEKLLLAPNVTYQPSSDYQDFEKLERKARAAQEAQIVKNLEISRESKELASNQGEQSTLQSRFESNFDATQKAADSTRGPEQSLIHESSIITVPSTDLKVAEATSAFDKAHSGINKHFEAFEEQKPSQVWSQQDQETRAAGKSLSSENSPLKSTHQLLVVSAAVPEPARTTQKQSEVEPSPARVTAPEQPKLATSTDSLPVLAEPFIDIGSPTTIINTTDSGQAPTPLQPEEPTSKDIAELDEFFDKHPLDLTALPEATVDIKDQLKDHSLEAELLKVEHLLKHDLVQAAHKIQVPAELLKAGHDILQKKRSTKLVSNILELESMISQGSKLAVLASSLKTPLNSLLGKRSPRDSSTGENQQNDEFSDWNSPYRHSVHTAKSYLEKISSPLQKNLQSIADWEIKSSNPMAAYTSSNRDRNLLYAQDGLDELEAELLGRSLSPTLTKPVQKFGQNLFAPKPSSKDTSLANQLKAALAGKPIPSSKPTPAKASPSGSLAISVLSGQTQGAPAPPQTPQKKKKYWMGPIPNPQLAQKETFSDNFRDSAKPSPTQLPTSTSHHPSGSYIPKPKPYWDRMLPEGKAQSSAAAGGIKMPTAKVLHSPAVTPGPFERLQAKFGQNTGQARHDAGALSFGGLTSVDGVVVLPPTKPMPGKGRVA